MNYSHNDKMYIEKRREEKKPPFTVLEAAAAPRGRSKAAKEEASIASTA